MINFTGGILTNDSLSTIVTRLTNEFKKIWDKDINVEQNSHDGQEINIRAQKEKDEGDVLIKIYNATKLDSAEDVDLDAICYTGALIRRKKGQAAIVDVVVTTLNDSITLSGLDSTGITFKVANTAGSTFSLISTTLLETAGDHTLSFQSDTSGNVEIEPNSVNSISTPVFGVDSVNNPAKQRIDGIERENDSSLRRRYKVAITAPSLGYLDGLVSSILEVNGVVSCKVYENDTESVDSNGISPKSLFIIVEGGNDQDIAVAIAKKKGAAAGMYTRDNEGKVEEVVELPGTQPKDIFFQRPNLVNLKIKIVVEEGEVKNSLAETACLGVKYGLGETAKVQDYYDAINTIDGYIASSVLISDDDGETYNSFIKPNDIVDVFISSEVEFE